MAPRGTLTNINVVESGADATGADATGADGIATGEGDVSPPPHDEVSPTGAGYLWVAGSDVESEHVTDAILSPQPSKSSAESLDASGMLQGPRSAAASVTVGAPVLTNPSASKRNGTFVQHVFGETVYPAVNRGRYGILCGCAIIVVCRFGLLLAFRLV